MSIAEFLESLNRRNVEVWIDNNQLRCKAPKSVLTSTLQEEIRKRKPELLQFLASMSGESTTGEICPISHQGPRPLSFAQQRLWFLAQLEPNSTAYHMPFGFRLQGPICVKTLEESLNILIQRHEALRTTFSIANNDPVQVIVPTFPFELSVVDLSHLSVEDQEHEIQRMRTNEDHQPFDLVTGPLFRVKVAKLHVEEHIFLLTLHHIISDGWSMEVFFRELTQVYQALSTGQQPSLQMLTLQYADFAVWQREWLQGAELDRQLEYWKTYLQAPLPVLSLPTDFPRPSELKYRSERVSFVVPARVALKLKRVSQQDGTTLFMTLLATFQLLLHRWSGQEDICVGIPSAGRTRVEIEKVMGFFINTLVIRTTLTEASSFLDILQQTRKSCLDAFQYQDVPFEKLVEELQPTRDLGRTPLFQVFVNMVPGDTEPFALHRLKVTRLATGTPESKFDLTLYLRDSAQELSATVAYNGGLFTTTRIEALVEQYQWLLEQIATAPEQSIHTYSLVPAARPSWLPDPQKELPIPSQDPVVTQFQAWSKHDPSQVAIQHGSRTISYGDLFTESERCARVLLRQGGGKRSQVVAIRGPRSIGLVTAIVGVWLADGVIVLLDPELPEARQRLLFEQSEASALIEIGQQSEHMWEPDMLSVSPMLIDPSTGAIASPGSTHGAADCPLPLLCETSPAYIFFTSGTTGMPKGVLGSHRALSHFLGWQRQTFSIDSCDRVAQLTGLSFDPILRDIFLPLTSGATVCLPPDTHHGNAVLEWLAAEQVTVVHLVPSVANFCLSSISAPIPLPSLRWVFFAGEPLTNRLLCRWETSCPGPTRFVNLYGATETTLVKCWYQIPVERAQGVQPIGQPLPETQLLVMGKTHRLCGAGEVGELVIRTPFRSLGYLHTQEGLNQRFIPNPYRTDPEDLLYHTGDLGRYRLDGTVEILGRQDDQVKIRGVRIEPQEVAAVLERSSDVQACTVLANPTVQGQYELTAYVVPTADRKSGVSYLRKYLSDHLPLAFVPTQYVFIDQMPLTPNGKIDRRVLRNFTSIEVPEEAYVEPRSAIEQQMVAIWQDVLGVEHIGVHDNFFELGGHSLLATQIISRVQEAFQVKTPLRTLFEAPTVAGLAGRVKQGEDHGVAFSPPPIQPLSSDEPMPLSFSQERMWFLHQFAPTSAAYNVSWPVHFHGLPDLVALEKAFNEILLRHAVLRTVFPDYDGRPTVVVQPFEPVTLPVLDLRQTANDLRETEAQKVATREAQHPFDLAKGPLVRATFVRVTDEHVIVLVTIHHIATDGWSIRIFRHELEALYAAFAARQPSPLEGLPIQYHDYAAWQRRWLQGEVLESQVTYWKQRLKDAPMVLDLPTDRPRLPYQTFVGGRHIIDLSRALTVGLNRLNRQEGVTLFMTLLASFAVQLGKYSSTDDLLVGVPIANRHFLATEELIGTFVNTLVLRTELGGDPTFIELLRQVRQTTLEAYAHQDLPFEVLVDALQPPRDLSRSPVFQVMLTVQNFVQAQSFKKEQVLGTGVNRQAAQFDLTLSVMERPMQQHCLIWSYNSDLFDPSTIERMGQQYVCLLEDVITQPRQRLHELSFLPASEREQILVSWNATAQPLSRSHMCLPHVLEAQAVSRPDRVAVIWEEQMLTYEGLNQKANQLAHYLCELGVGPEVRVALYCERTLELVIGLWAIVKAGGAYVPLDPTYPQERIALMLDDAAVTVIVAHKAGVPPLLPHTAQVVWVDADREQIGRQPTTNLPARNIPENLAYMIYTSGSTGRPKGVQISHRTLMNFLEAMSQDPGMAEVDRLLAVTSLSFDIAGLEIFAPALAGGEVVVASRMMAADGAQLIHGLMNHAITVMQATPVTWQLLLANGWKGQPMMRILCGGEQLSLDLAQQLLECAQGVWNLYGPTETTVWSTCTRLNQQTQRITVGGPIVNTQVYVQDRWGAPVPVGVPGELSIGGDGVARGYWRRPVLTAEKFIPDPYTTRPGRRVYRTGDVVRYRADGKIEWLARLDHQIKLRGYRIELGEIEVRLRRLTGVQDSVVIIWGGKGKSQQLVAYITMMGGYQFEPNEAREALQQQIPGFMIPDVFVELSTFPLTPNGKINRKALPAPVEADRTQGMTYVAPRTTLEELVAAIWQEVLDLERVGIHDNFFALGGHSLLATKLIARLRTVLELNIPLRILFEHSTIATFAVALDRLLPEVFPDAGSDAPV